MDPHDRLRVLDRKTTALLREKPALVAKRDAYQAYLS